MSNTIQLFETIHTERLYLRRFQESDLEDMYEYLSDPEVMKYEPLLTEEECREWAAARLASNDFWAVCLADNGKMIGDIYMGKGEYDNWELGYVFSSRYQKQGYAAEASGPLICRTFLIEGAHRICIFCNPYNIASCKFAERLGFRLEGHIKQNVYFRQDRNGNPIWQDTLLYGILKEEWVQNHASSQRQRLLAVAK